MARSRRSAQDKLVGAILEQKYGAAETNGADGKRM
jgi:hypothetical protein